MGKTVFTKAECLRIDVITDRSTADFVIRKPGTKDATNAQGQPLVVASVAIQFTFEGDKAKNFFPGKEYKITVEE